MLRTPTARLSLAPQSSGRRRALISLTPLIDVVFILLVFFMLASSFLNWRAIALDAPARAGAGASVEGALLVDVRTDGLRLGGATVSLEKLAAKAQEAMKREPDRRVLVRPAKGVPVQDVVTVLDRLTAVGVDNISLVRVGR